MTRWSWFGMAIGMMIGLPILLLLFDFTWLEAGMVAVLAVAVNLLSHWWRNRTVQKKG